ncbi:hypothetical protein EJ73_00714 [Hoylesella shahii DSM 15611 = JCM 12083]|uniref:Uncharacterized protein n=1 Tax=Hoylesella shahii DSM 15611 = JCM 12083 TaxID=1122991 RepID=A0A318HXJ5_9BACT|nr:hypothetical protein EJ73_00714 [Hoylesella shahii DSM 15611 = JCM 12083]
MPKFVSTYSILYAYNGLKRSLRGEYCALCWSLSPQATHLLMYWGSARMVLTKFLLYYGVRA